MIREHFKVDQWVTVVDYPEWGPATVTDVWAGFVEIRIWTVPGSVLINDDRLRLI